MKGRRMHVGAGSRGGLLGIALAVTLVLPASAWALGLGPIQTDTRIGQPFSARIPIVGASANDLQGLTVGLASTDAYKQAGLSEPDFLFDLKFSVETGANGPYVLVTSSQSVRLPFLNLLVHANWSSGEVTRQYTVLLNPPVFASGGQAASVATPAAAAPARQQAAPQPPPQRPQPARRPAPGAQPHSYGPVPRGDTLWGIAHRLRPDASVSINQMMVALYRANPDAFNGNINRLKAGYILRVPSAGDIDQVSAASATAEVARQNAAWRGAAGGAPTAVASNAGATRQSASTAQGGAGSEAQPAGAPAGVSPSSGAASGGQGRVVLTTPEVTGAGAVAAAGAGGRPAASTPTPAIAAAASTQAGGAAQGGRSAAVTAASTPGAAKVNSELAGILGTRSGASRAAKPAPAKAQSSVNSVNTATPEETGTLRDWLTSPKGWIAAAVVVLLLAALVLLLLRRRAMPGDVGEGKPAAGEEPAAPAHAGSFGETYQAPGEWREEEHEPTGDALERATRHADYGEYEEAAAVLRAAIAAEPGRRDLRMKLLEVLFVAGEAEAFRSQAAELRDSGFVAEDDPDWQKVSGMGRQLLPEDALFAMTSSPFDGERSPVEQQAQADEEAPHEAAPLDFDVALEESGESEQTQTEPLEFERIVDELSTFIETYIPGSGGDEAALEIDRPAVETAEEAPADSGGEEDLSIEFEEMPDIPSPEEIDTEADFEAEADEDAEAESGEAGAVDPIGTKLDLARAYVDLGDPESARSMLEEVLDEGDEAQRNEARRLLDALI